MAENHPPDRNDRRHIGEGSHDPGVDYRTPAQRDRDRILQTSALRRLADVTQVVAPMEGHGFHNRLTHTIKVAQIGKRLAQRLLMENEPELIEAHGGVDPDAVEAACLGHDLGHPPFGHVAEEVLDTMLRAGGLSDGFEGNAQSFRILTKLAIRSERHPGLNLTRATLDAAMKYPWQRHPGDTKFAAYLTETDDFNFARTLSRTSTRSLDAEIMDWADDIAYSVHDLEDFYKAGLLPLQDLTQSREIRKRFLEETRERWLLNRLLADGGHLWTDVLSTAGVLVGVVLAAVTGWMQLDAVLALRQVVDGEAQVVGMDLYSLVVPEEDGTGFGVVLDVCLHLEGALQESDGTVVLELDGEPIYVVVRVIDRGTWLVATQSVQDGPCPEGLPRP